MLSAPVSQRCPSLHQHPNTSLQTLYIRPLDQDINTWQNTAVGDSIPRGIGQGGAGEQPVAYSPHVRVLQRPRQESKGAGTTPHPNYSPMVGHQRQQRLGSMGGPPTTPSSACSVLDGACAGSQQWGLNRFIRRGLRWVLVQG